MIGCHKTELVSPKGTTNTQVKVATYTKQKGQKRR